jgi:hypothetical protein
LAAAGCSSAPEPGWWHLGRATPVVLFDPKPGWPMASDMGYRSSWPAALAWQDHGEHVWYRERMIDIQSGGWGFGRVYDRVYRRFDTYRVGHGAR